MTLQKLFGGCRAHHIFSVCSDQIVNRPDRGRGTPVSCNATERTTQVAFDARDRAHPACSETSDLGPFHAELSESLASYLEAGAEPGCSGFDWLGI